MSLPAIVGNDSQTDTLTNVNVGNNSRQPELTQSGRRLGSIRNYARRRLHLDQTESRSPGHWLNPTHARFRVRWQIEEDVAASPDTSDTEKKHVSKEIILRWSSRYNRKGRNAFVLSRSIARVNRDPTAFIRRIRSNLTTIGRNIFRMLFSFPYWDMAFWSGWAYSLGSALFTLYGAFTWIPRAFPYTTFTGEGMAASILFFLGAILFEAGATFGYFEAINDGTFHGTAMRHFLNSCEEDQKQLLDEKLQAFFGRKLSLQLGDKQETVVKPKKHVTRPMNYIDIEAGWNPGTREWDPFAEWPSSESLCPQPQDDVETIAPMQNEKQRARDSISIEHHPWRWWPTWHTFTSHHVREVGWWACAIQLLGATFYGVAGVVALPGIINTLQQWQMNAGYWIPQIIASACFLMASLLFTIETQEKWYRPEFNVLGWWVGIWSCVGSVGFLLCGALGPVYGRSGARYQSSLSSVWGSAAFLISGLLQWYEAVNKHPIEGLLSEPKKMKSFEIQPV